MKILFKVSCCYQQASTQTYAMCGISQFVRIFVSSFMGLIYRHIFDALSEQQGEYVDFNRRFLTVERCGSLYLRPLPMVEALHDARAARWVEELSAVNERDSVRAVHARAAGGRSLVASARPQEETPVEDTMVRTENTAESEGNTTSLELFKLMN